MLTGTSNFVSTDVKYNREDKIIISLDSVRADSFPILQKYAKGAFKKYLESSFPLYNVIADNTQTEGSFQSVFSGKPIFLHKNRYPFSDRFSYENQKQLSFFTELKNNGFRNIVIRDEMETAFIEPGPAFDETILTSPNKKLSVLLNKINHSFVIFLLLPTTYNKIFLPTMFDNSNQPLGYHTGRIVDKILFNIKNEYFKSKSLNKKNIIFVHSCISHLPVKLKFPYNTLTPPHDIYESYSYADFTINRDFTEVDSENMRFEYDYNYYLKMLEYTTESFLNPLFESLAQSENYNSNNIILMSDHGENFWNSRKTLPIRLNFPFHGDNDLFGSHADRPLFVSNQKISQDQLLNLSQVFKAALTNSPINPHLVYSENGFSLSDEGKDSINLISFSNIVSEFSKKLNNEKLTLSEDFEAISSLSRQRSIYDRQYKVSLYRTSTGRKIFVCDQKNDIYCITNLWGRNINNFSWIKQLNTVLENDIQNGIEVPLSLNKNHQIDTVNDWNLHKNSKSQWLNLYAAIVEINLFATDNLLTGLKSDPSSLLFSAIEETKKRYPLQIKNLSAILKDLDTFKSIYDKLFTNRLYFIINQHVGIRSSDNISDQLKSVSNSEKKKLYHLISSELSSIFRYSNEYLFAYQNQLYFSLLLKFSLDLDSRNDFVKFYEEHKKTELPLPFRNSLEEYLYN